ncbi:MAG: trigger factor, partial [Actinobacteria bacterium]
PRSSVVLEVEVPPERVARSVEQAVARLARSTRVPGFRPGRAPRAVLERVVGPERVLDEAFEHLIPDTLEEALTDAAVIPLIQPDVEVVQRDEGKPLIYRATVPVRPEVTLGDYRNFPFAIEVEEIDAARVAQVLEELRDQQATLVPVEDRPARDGDYLIIAFEGRRDGETFEGGSADRYPIVIGAGRMIPGFEEQLVGMAIGAEKTFSLTFPDDYPDKTLAGKPVEFTVSVHEIREKVLPPLDDDLARSLGEYADLDALHIEVGKRLEANAIEVMFEELAGRLARDNISLKDYLEAVGKDEAAIRGEYRPRAEQRAKVLLVLNAVADAEDFQIPDEALEAELGRIRGRHPDDPRLVAYFESPRGRVSLRASLRRSAIVERIVDEWLAAHPEVGPVPHLEDDEAQRAEAAGVTAATIAG